MKSRPFCPPELVDALPPAVRQRYEAGQITPLDGSQLTGNSPQNFRLSFAARDGARRAKAIRAEHEDDRRLLPPAFNVPYRFGDGEGYDYSTSMRRRYESFGGGTRGDTPPGPPPRDAAILALMELGVPLPSVGPLVAIEPQADPSLALEQHVKIYRTLVGLGRYAVLEYLFRRMLADRRRQLAVLYGLDPDAVTVEELSDTLAADDSPEGDERRAIERVFYGLHSLMGPLPLVGREASLPDLDRDQLRAIDKRLEQQRRTLIPEDDPPEKQLANAAMRQPVVEKKPETEFAPNAVISGTAPYPTDPKLAARLEKFGRVSGAMRDARIATGRRHYGQAIDTDFGLSWRIMLLPYLGRERYFAQFDTDGDNNYTANKGAEKRTPDVYDTGTKPGTTTFRQLTGRQALRINWAAPRDPLHGDLRSSLLAVDVGEEQATPWTPLFDLNIDTFASPLPDLLGQPVVPEEAGGPGWYVACGDGDVRLMPATVTTDVFLSMIDAKKQPPAESPLLAIEWADAPDRETDPWNVEPDKDDESDDVVAEVETDAETNAEDKPSAASGGGVTYPTRRADRTAVENMRVLAGRYRSWTTDHRYLLWSDHREPPSSYLGVSWRIKLLRYIDPGKKYGGGLLYKFLDHSKDWRLPVAERISGRMPVVYDTGDRPFHTRLLQLIGPGSAIENAPPVVDYDKMVRWLNGEQTILFVLLHPDQAVHWTSPRGVVINEGDGIDVLGPPAVDAAAGGPGWYVLTQQGKVKLLAASISPGVFGELVKYGGSPPRGILLDVPEKP